MRRVEVSAEQQDLAEGLDRRVETYVAALLSFYAALVAALRGIGTEIQIDLALNAYVLAIKALNEDAIWETGRWAVSRAGLGENLNYFTQGNLRTAAVYELALRQIQDAKRAAADRAEVSGRSYKDELVDQVTSKTSANRLRKELDAEVTQAASSAIWNEGLQKIRYKLVVATIDSDTTDLCRRLHGTVWEWDKPVVDPVSGGQRMFPPFIGPDFEPQFHHCRSMIAPYTGRV